eukprot:CAMPEP_0171468558 /NCGR_PEP_ID=MMETSP0945-20130129/10675_1 /TAXON_ID=109269 /ORGANISM="Vaucheria litorea, Strain CCMP2940" /LENGTH=248 /DNA_ID=CAMNT_0011997363 /DNA_START=26 /DNA_END=769 /DNA_ORIENTATION=-
MTFRFATRTAYESGSTADAQNIDLIGDFGYADMTVNFDATIEPLTLTTPTANLPCSKTADHACVERGRYCNAVAKGKIYIAENKVPTVTAADFDYEEHEVPLEWFLVGEVDNTGSATMEVPQIVENKQVQVLVMIRGDNDACTFYDMASKLSLSAVDAPVDANPVGGDNGDLAGSTSSTSGNNLPLWLTGGGVIVAGLAFAVLRNRRSTQSKSGNTQQPPGAHAVGPYGGQHLGGGQHMGGGHHMGGG